MAFTFPADTNHVIGAVRPTPSGNDFFIPTILYEADGETVLFTTPNPGYVGLIGNLAVLTLAPATTLLGAGQSYVSSGTLLNVSTYDKLVGTVYSDQAGNLYVQQGYDGVHWDVSSLIAVTGGTGSGYDIAVVAPYAQLTYVNGGTAQGVFRLNLAGKVM